MKSQRAQESTPTKVSKGCSQTMYEADYSDTEYVQNWRSVLIGTTSAMLFVTVSYVCYLCYELARPYFTGISCGILVSVVFRPSNHNEAKSQCVAAMREHNQKRRTSAWHLRIGSSWLSIPIFAEYILMEGARFVGLHKMPFVSYSQSRTADRIAMMIAFIAIVVLGSSIAFGVITVLVPLMVILVLMILLVPFLDELTFVSSVGKLAKVSFAGYAMCALVYNFSLDVITVTEQVKNGTSRLIDSKVVGENITDVVLGTIQDRVFQDIALSFNATNVTQAAMDIREAFGPFISNMSMDRQWLMNQSAILMVALSPNATEVDALDAVSQLTANVGAKWKPFLDVLFAVVQWALSNIVNIFDLIYETLLFVFTYRYLAHLPNTVLYYVLVKAMSVVKASNCSTRARIIESDIIDQFLSLFQSFWHITWFHFFVTFTCLKYCEIPVPFLCGIAAVVMALFPLLPKWMSPCAVATVICSVLDARHGWNNLLSERTLVLLFGTMLVYTDEWLLSVEKRRPRRRGHSIRGSSGPSSNTREQTPPFVIGTCIILGLVSYGMRGIVLGPLIVIVARTLFDNFGIDSTISVGVSGRTGSIIRNSSFTTPLHPLPSQKKEVAKESTERGTRWNKVRDLVETTGKPSN